MLPVPNRLVSEEPGLFTLGRLVPWFPLVGAAVGAAGGAVRLATEPLLGRTPATALAVGALVIITGGLHQDGLADTADGLGVRGDRARRLAVMGDSATGAFGVLAIALWAILLVSVLASLSGTRVLLALITAGALSRAGAPIHALAAGAARPGGLGASLRATPAAAALAVLLAVLVALGGVGAGRAGIAVGVWATWVVLSILWARRALQGSTGDTMGAVVVVGELAVCAALLASWR